MIAAAPRRRSLQLCFGAFAIIRAMSTRNDDPARASPAVRRAAATASSWREGAAVLVLEEREPRACARRADLRRDLRLRAHQRRASHDRAATRRLAGRARHADRARRGARRAARGRLHQRPRHLQRRSTTPRRTRSIKQVFGDHASEAGLSGTKGYYGHALGASGAIEAAICALASRRGWLPPTVNLETPDPACDLTHVTGEGRDDGAGVPAQQLVRIRRHQCGIGLPAGRGDRLDSRPSSPSLRRSTDVLSAAPLDRRSPRHIRPRLHRHRCRRQQVLPGCQFRCLRHRGRPRDGPLGHDHRDDEHLGRVPQPRRDHRAARRSASGLPDGGVIHRFSTGRVRFSPRCS